MPKSDPEEMLPVIDEDGTVIRMLSRRECHGGSMALHPVVHLHVVDVENRRILLQKRSLNKDVQPGKWDTCVGGHVDAGESIHEALMREASEEMGVDASEAIHLTDYIFQSDIEREKIHIYILKAESVGEIKYDVDEISEVSLVNIDKIGEQSDMEYTPNFLSEFNEYIKPLFKKL